MEAFLPGRYCLEYPASFSGISFTSACVVGACNLQGVEIDDLLLQESARPLEIYGDLESRLFPETLDDAFKTDCRDLFVRVAKVCEQGDFGSGRHRLLERYSGPVDTDVV